MKDESACNTLPRCRNDLHQPFSHKKLRGAVFAQSSLITKYLAEHLNRIQTGWGHLSPPLV